MQKNLVKFSGVLFKLCERTDRQTDRQTGKLMPVLCNPPRGELTTEMVISVVLII